MQQKSTTRIIMTLLLFLLVLVYFKTGIGSYLSLASLKEHHSAFKLWFDSHPLPMALGFGLAYVLITALSIPGAAVMTLAAGAIFGVIYGTLIVSFASTTGATLAFLGARFLFRDSVEAKFRHRLGAINQGIKKDGAFYLFTLRLIPAFPFFLINILMGLTSLRVLTFFFVSQIGMLPGTIVYVNAGTQLAQLESLKGILSPQLLISFSLLGLVPLICKWLINYWKSRRHLGRYRKPASFDYNMVVIGGGSAGLVSAYIAAAVKAKVALVEKHRMGGDCLNTGCVPSKALIRSAKILKYTRRAHEFGLPKVDPAPVDLAKVMDHIRQVIQEIEPHDSIERYTNLGVECITGEAKILSPYEVKVGDRILTTKNIVVATGARPLVPALPGLNQVEYLTSDNVWNLRQLPKHLVILGGGPIGCELAQSFARFGSKVTIVEQSDRLLAREDREVSQLIEEHFQREGIEVRTSRRALSIETTSTGQTLICEKSGQVDRIEFDKILIAVGRKANVTGFGLEELGVEVSASGTILADEYLRTTNYPNIFVCGDVTGPYQLTHAASHQAWYVAVNALFSPFKKYKVDYRVIPWCTFTDPEVARVGLSETEAKAQGLAYRVSKYELSDLDRAIAEGEAHGFVKVLTPPNSDRILGVTIVGPHAGDIIAEYVAAMKHEFGLNKILSTIHIYPTFAEANKYAAGVWKKQTAPVAALEWLARFHRFRR